MNRVRVPISIVILMLVPAVVAAGVERSSLLTIEGRVVSVATHPGEGDLQLVAVRLDLDEDQQRTVGILLAPVDAMAEAGFQVEEGDRLRVKIFGDDEEPVRVHKARNLSRDTMVRLRTLRQIPLWDSEGVWQGGPGRGPGAQQGQRGRGNGPGRSSGQNGRGGGPR